MTFDAAKFPALLGHENEANWFLHKIVTSVVRHKHDAHHDGLVHLSRETMKQFIKPNDIKAVRNTLISEGVVVVNESYRISEPAKGILGYSQSYGLSEAYAGGLRRVEVTKKSLAAKILRHRLVIENRVTTVEELDDTLAYLNGWLRRLHIDTESAHRIIQQLPDKPLKVTRVRVGKRGRRKVVRVAMPDAKALNCMVVDTIGNAEWEWAICPFGRLHTNVTRLITDCRSCLSIGGSCLAAVDVANSQLIFFLLLLLEARTQSGGEEGTEGDGPHPPRGNNSKEEGTDPNRGPDQGSTPRSVIGGKGPDQYDPYLAPDEIRFKGRVLGGTVYDHLMGLTGYTDRKKFKGDFFEAVLYGDNAAYYSRNSPVAKAFKTEYPSVWRFVEQAKKWDGKGAKEDAFKRLARQMQTREARFMIGRVCGRLAAHHGHIPAITIHDSLMTTPEHMPTVVRIIEEEFARIGVRPKLKVENASEPTCVPVAGDPNWVGAAPPPPRLVA